MALNKKFKQDAIVKPTLPDTEEVSRFMGYIVNFGKYKGKTYLEIFDTDYSYFRWMLRNMNAYSRTFAVLSPFVLQDDRNAAHVKAAQQISKINKSLVQ